MGTVSVYFSVPNLPVNRSEWLQGIEALTAEFINDDQKGQPDAGGNGGGLHGLCRFTVQALWLFAPCLSFVFGVRRALS